jgi:hypothetical protein
MFSCGLILSNHLSAGLVLNISNTRQPLTDPTFVPRVITQEVQCLQSFIRDNLQSFIRDNLLDVSAKCFVPPS